MSNSSSVAFFRGLRDGHIAARGDCALEGDVTILARTDVDAPTGDFEVIGQATFTYIDNFEGEGEADFDGACEFSVGHANGDFVAQGEADIFTYIFAPFAAMTIEVDSDVDVEIGAQTVTFSADGDMALQGDGYFDINLTEGDIALDGWGLVVAIGTSAALADSAFDAEADFDAVLVPMNIALIPIEFDSSSVFGASATIGGDGDLQLDGESDVVNSTPPTPFGAIALIELAGESIVGALQPADSAQGDMVFSGQATAPTTIAAEGDFRVDGEVLLGQTAALPPFCVQSEDIFVPGAVAMEVCA